MIRTSNEPLHGVAIFCEGILRIYGWRRGVLRHPEYQNVILRWENEMRHWNSSWGRNLENPFLLAIRSRDPFRPLSLDRRKGIRDAFLGQAGYVTDGVSGSPPNGRPYPSNILSFALELCTHVDYQRMFVFYQYVRAFSSR